MVSSSVVRNVKECKPEHPPPPVKKDTSDENVDNVLKLVQDQVNGLQSSDGCHKANDVETKCKCV